VIFCKASCTEGKPSLQTLLVELSVDKEEMVLSCWSPCSKGRRLFLISASSLARYPLVLLVFLALAWPSVPLFVTEFMAVGWPIPPTPGE